MNYEFALEELLATQSKRTLQSQEVVERELNYFVSHLDDLHYQAMEQASGAPRGSGSVESLGNPLQRRLRGCGQNWNRPGSLICCASASSSKTRTISFSGIENYQQTSGCTGLFWSFCRRKICD
jgi:hypothetical protein